jgi:hypothetical protein
VIHLVAQESVAPDEGALDQARKSGSSPMMGVALASVMATCAGGAIALWWHRSRHRIAFGKIAGDDAELKAVRPKPKAAKRKGGKVEPSRQDTFGHVTESLDRMTESVQDSVDRMNAARQEHS